MPTLSEVLHEALNLGVQDRAALVQQLLSGLDDLSEEEAEQLWADEAARRYTEYRAGRAEARAADAVHERARQQYE